MQISDEMRVRLNNPLIFVYLLIAVLPFVSSGLSITNAGIILPLFFAAAAVLSIHFSYRRKELLRNLLPISLILMLALSYYEPSRIGNAYWPVAYGMALFASCLWATRLMNSEAAFVLGVFLVSTYIHAVPVLMTDYIEEIDPYYDYKWGAAMIETGKIPVHDWQTYPKIGGLDRSLMPFGFAATMAYMGNILTMIGQGYHQAALLISALAAGLSVVVMFMLIKEFLYKKENAKYAAMFGAFILMMSIGWSTKAHATDSENDAIGGFILLSLFLAYMYAVNRGELKFSILVTSIIYGVFVTVWDGHKIFSMVIAMAVALMSFYGAYSGKRTLDYLKHYAAIIIGGNLLWRLIIHKPEQIFSTLMPSGIELASFALIVFAVGFNEFMLRYKNSVSISKHQVLAVVGLFAVGIAIFGPTAWYNFYKVGFVDIGQPSVVFKTIAEQQPFASTFSGYLTALYSVFGLGAMAALICIPLMLYVGIKQESFGELVMFSWLVPFVWGLYNKSQYIFLASIPFAIGGAWFVQYIISSKKDYDGLKIIPTLIALAAVVMYSPLGALATSYDSSAIFYNVATYDRMGWESTLQYFKNSTAANTAIITWWDYGHWLTAVSHRFVLIDNLQYDHREIQDVARFFMMDDNEDNAYKTIETYQGYYDSNPDYKQFGGVNLDYVAIDWTMIGKSGAMRFIATGNLTNQADGEYNSYTVCQFLPQYSNVNGSLVTDSNGGFAMAKTLVFGCTYNSDGLNGVIATIKGDSASFEAVTQDGNRIAWGTWLKAHDSSLMGVKTLGEILTVCMQYPDRINNIPPTYTHVVYASGKFKNFMLARLYFGDSIESFKSAGLANVDWVPLKHFVKDKSFEEGFVETWRIVRNTNTTTSDGGRIL